MGIIGYILGLYWDNGKENGNYYLGCRIKVTLKEIEYGVYGDLNIIYPMPYSIYLKGDYKINFVLNS